MKCLGRKAFDNLFGPKAPQLLVEITSLLHYSCQNALDALPAGHVNDEGHELHEFMASLLITANLASRMDVQYDSTPQQPRSPRMYVMLCSQLQSRHQ